MLDLHIIYDVFNRLYALVEKFLTSSNFLVNQSNESIENEPIDKKQNLNLLFSIPV